MCHSIDIFRYRVLDTFVIVGNAVVTPVVIGIDGCAFVYIVSNKRMQGLGISAIDYCCSNFIGLSILNANNSGLANSSATRVLEGLSLGVRHIPALAANEGLVNLYRTQKIDVAVLKGFADAVCQVPGILLGNVQVTMKFQTGHSLQAGLHLEYGNCPGLAVEV